MVLSLCGRSRSFIVVRINAHNFFAWNRCALSCSVLCFYLIRTFLCSAALVTNGRGMFFFSLEGVVRLVFRRCCASFEHDTVRWARVKAVASNGAWLSLFQISAFSKARPLASALPLPRRVDSNAGTKQRDLTYHSNDLYVSRKMHRSEACVYCRHNACDALCSCTLMLGSDLSRRRGNLLSPQAGRGTRRVTRATCTQACVRLVVRVRVQFDSLAVEKTIANILRRAAS
jgi:hypothetical protein